jgi:hypothetical protein
MLYTPFAVEKSMIFLDNFPFNFIKEISSYLFIKIIKEVQK